MFKKKKISKGENFFFSAHEALTLIKSTEEEMKHFGGDKKKWVHFTAFHALILYQHQIQCGRIQSTVQ